MKGRRKSNRGRGGFATVIALVAFAVAAAALLSIVAQVAADSRRTREALVAAQLRQLLAAGADAAVDRARTWEDAAPTDGQSWSQALPASLAEEGAVVKLTAKISQGVQGKEASQIDVLVDALSAGQKGGQTLRFRHGAGGWELVSVKDASVR